MVVVDEPVITSHDETEFRRDHGGLDLYALACKDNEERKSCMPFAEDKERPIWGQSDIVMPFAVVIPQSHARLSTMALLAKTYATLLGRGVESSRCASLSSGLGPVCYATRYDELCNLLVE